MAVNVVHKVSMEGGKITLAELREFVAAADDAGTPDDAVIKVNHYPGDQREGAWTTISVDARKTK